MAKPKKKLTAAQRAEKKRRKRDFMTIFIHGKQKRVRRPPTIDGVSVEAFIRQNADDIWLHQNEQWEIIHERAMAEQESMSKPHSPVIRKPEDPEQSDDIPF